MKIKLYINQTEIEILQLHQEIKLLQLRREIEKLNNQLLELVEKQRKEG